MVLKASGFPNVQNFIGSWHEWSRRKDLAVRLPHLTSK